MSADPADSPPRARHEYRDLRRLARSVPAAGILAATALLGLLSTACRERPPRPAEASAPLIGKTEVKTPPAKAGKVLLVQSYHPEYEWVASSTRGIKRALGGTSIELQVYYMDTKRHTSGAFKQQAGQAAMSIVNEWKPDVVIAVDDNAQQYFAKDLAGKDTPQVVFCGVNAEPEAYGYPASNVTGIIERPHYQASLNVLRQLRPNAKRIALVSDNSETSDGGLRHMRQQKTDFEIVACERPATFKEWQAAILRCQPLADAIAIYMYHTVKPEHGDQSMEPKEVMTWTVANSKLPIVGFFIFAVDDGVLCGYLESGVEHGFKAGQMAVQLLKGTPAKDIPLVTALEGQSMLNLKTARQLGIEVPEAVRRQTNIVIGE